MSNTTPQDLLEAYEDTTMYNNRTTVGRTDAVYHAGKLLAGNWSAEFVTDLQNDIADTAHPDYDAPYHYGYLVAWEALAGLIKGEPLKTIARNHG